MALLREAAERGDLAGVQQLLGSGAPINDTGLTKWTALHRASERGRADVVKLLLGAGADHSLLTAAAGETALHLAADRGHTTVVAELIGAGANVHAKSKRGWTPFHAAVFSNRGNVVRQLVTAGAEEDSEAPFTLAAGGMTNLVSPRLAGGGSPKALHVSGMLARTPTATTGSLYADMFSPQKLQAERRALDVEHQRRREEREAQRRQADEARLKREAERERRREGRRRELNLSLRVDANAAGAAATSVSPALDKTAKEMHLEAIKTDTAPMIFDAASPSGFSLAEKEERLRQISAGGRTFTAPADMDPAAPPRALGASFAAAAPAAADGQDKAAQVTSARQERVAKDKDAAAVNAATAAVAAQNQAEEQQAAAAAAAATAKSKAEQEAKEAQLAAEKELKEEAERKAREKKRVRRPDFTCMHLLVKSGHASSSSRCPMHAPTLLVDFLNE